MFDPVKPDFNFTNLTESAPLHHPLVTWCHAADSDRWNHYHGNTTATNASFQTIKMTGSSVSPQLL